jgi:hypothetical protein
MEPELIFMTACLGFGALFIAWCMMVGRLRAWALLGISGALLGALVTGSLWQADQLPWLGTVLKPMLVVWMGAAALNGFAMSSVPEEPRSTRVLVIVLVVLGFVLHAGALLLFMALATMGV